MLRVKNGLPAKINHRVHVYILYIHCCVFSILAHQLLIRAGTAKYLEILLSVCLYFIRSEYHESLEVTSQDHEGNFAVQSTSAEVLTQVSYYLLEIASDSGKGFSSYINDLLSRSKIQRISLHCLLSTVYAITSDYRETNETGYYSMVEYPNLTETTPRKNHLRSHIDLQRSLLKFIESIIHLEFKIGTENVAAQTNDKKSKKENNGNVSNVPAFEYIYTIQTCCITTNVYLCCSNTY